MMSLKDSKKMLKKHVFQTIRRLFKQKNEEVIKRLVSLDIFLKLTFRTKEMKRYLKIG